MEPAGDSNSSPAPAPARKAGDWAVRVFATALGFGYLPGPSGTWGTLPAVGLFLAVMLLFRAEPAQSIALGGLLLATCAASVPLGNRAARVFGRDDPKQFVLDEVAGFLLTVLLFRRGELVALTAWAFVVTRIFDIVKIPPARQAEDLPGGWGILIDDLISSLYAAAVLHGTYLLFPILFAW